MGLSSMLEKVQLGRKSPGSDVSEQHQATLATDQGVQQYGQDSDDDEDEKDGGDDADAYRIVILKIQNETGFPIQMIGWPSQGSKDDDFALSTYRGAKTHTSVPVSGTIFTDPDFQLGQTRGPRRFDLRDRWVWVYFDLVTTERKVHLQAFVKLDWNGVVAARLGRTDLDSTKDNPTSSGDAGSVVVDPGKRLVTYVIDKSVVDMENIVDDSTKRGIDVRGKGIETNTWMSYHHGRISVIVGNTARYHEMEQPSPGHRIGQLRSSKHRITGIASRYVGVFVEHNIEPWFQGHIRVHPVTGIATGVSFNRTSETTAIFREEDDAMICYGFHDAGEGRRSQIYVYVTPGKSNWLGDLISANDKWLDVPFSRLALAAAHDAGMFGHPINAGLLSLIQEGELGHALAGNIETKLASPVVRTLVDILESIRLSPNRALANIAMTQKDSFVNQLRIGVRFFDFRPGFCFHDVIHTKKGELYHQHAIVPGESYKQFLLDILNFLATHPKEIVVVELKDDGFLIKKDKYRKEELVVYSMVPSEEELAAVLEQARAEAKSDLGREIVLGGPNDLDATIGSLLEQKKRLIMIDRVHHAESWERDDSYDPVAYNTDDPSTIIAALEKMHARSSQPTPKVDGKPSPGAIYQLQATPTANLMSDVFASLTYSDSSSLLTYVKPIMDRVTYPWLQSHKFEQSGLVVLLNDFVEGVLVEHAVEISKQRAGLL
ncbi:BZ3500_MvSof-1268-A1-R1_Chr11-1g03316 [Microbotryum saponariae]|uniref:BZ3500_MvSof-1268-A1-R1_Chr11-1g03316 protein n=1 Tax=Microbotryum saponariae TaxID=289078 RepID=A0A2X0NFN7_9BASI|nr:BZ3501_MvSof-1269-A2-R1_Chr11g02892 [Microbotryum saponariae]SDA03947.1 BZ3500_MvSof-1268-A1-R1_Chr11-1g03316 [Microbotryum saponariae]